MLGLIGRLMALRAAKSRLPPVMIDDAGIAFADDSGIQFILL